MNFKFFLSLITALLIFSSCDSERQPLLPNITGQAGEVVIIVNGYLWDAESGQALKKFLAKDAEVLPQSEPMFNVIQVPWASFTNIFKSHRNLILVSVKASEPKGKMVVRRNVWAKPQTVIEILAPNETELAEFIASQSERITNHFLIAERNRIIDNYKRYEKREIGERLWKNHGFSLVIPPGYTLDVDTEGFVWIGNETPRTSQGVLVYYYDYEGDEAFSEEYLIYKRNLVLREKVPGPIKNSYMTTELNVETSYSEFLMNERYFAELRGLWRVENDFMGGPFVSLSTLDEKNNRVITAEAYVFAPNTNKRNLLRQAEAILYTLKLEEVNDESSIAQ